MWGFGERGINIFEQVVECLYCSGGVDARGVVLVWLGSLDSCLLDIDVRQIMHAGPWR